MWQMRDRFELLVVVDEEAAGGDHQDRHRRIVFQPQLARPREEELAFRGTAVIGNLQEARAQGSDVVEIGLDARDVGAVLIRQPARRRGRSGVLAERSDQASRSCEGKETTPAHDGSRHGSRYRRSGATQQESRSRRWRHPVMRSRQFTLKIQRFTNIGVTRYLGG
jgi:hypothetical protein